ncbi:MAG: rod shape-determining protein [Thermoanaerobacterales bacterium]|nr:rod shape-determining protein [Bacillota bacterium]MDI6906400.1 rod shape-determining protein [Thermoanaerobacterales bacterium]
MFNWAPDIGIDLGTATVLVYVKGKGIVLREPSVVAINKDSGQIIAVGQEARRMLGRTPGNIVATRPLRDGVIADFDVTERMLRYFINKAGCRRMFLRPRVMICIPAEVTGVEERAVRQAALQAGARQAHVIEEPMAAALGAGVDVSQASGSMIVDIGGGTTDVAVISLGGIVAATSIKVGGDKFDEAIVRYARREFSLMIGERSAEELKIDVGTAYPSRTEDRRMPVRGRDVVSGLPKAVEVSSRQIWEAIQEPLLAVVAAVKEVLEKTPPELAADLVHKGIIMTGGGSLLNGLDNLISEETGLPAMLADDPVSCVALGTGRALSMIGVLPGSPKQPNIFRRVV